MIRFRCTQKARLLIGLDDRDLSDEANGDLEESDIARWSPWRPADSTTLRSVACFRPSVTDFAKTNNRAVTGSMTDHIKNRRWYFEERTPVPRLI